MFRWAVPSTTGMFLAVSAARFLAAGLGVAAALGTAPARAGTYYWDVNGTTAGFSTVVGAWNGTNQFWNTSSTGGAGTLIAVPTSADDLTIPQATTNTGSITVSGTQSASSITFAANVGPTVTITGGTITIGGTGTTSGIFEASTGANTVSTALTLNSAVTGISIGNTSTGLLTVGAITGSATTGNTQTLSIGSSHTGNITLNGIIGNGAAGGNVALAVNNTSTGITTLSGANTFTGGLTIKAGTVSGTTIANAFGGTASVITIGDSTGSANATLSGGLNGTFANPIKVAGGNAGVATITSTTSTATFSGAVTLDSHDLYLSPAAANVTLSGSMTGTGNLVLNSTGAGVITRSGTTNIVGTITNSGGGAATNVISGAIGTNVTGVVQNSTTSALTLSGNSTFTGPVTLTAGTLRANTNAAALGTGAATLSLNGGTTLDFNNSAALNFGRPTTIGGDVTIISQKNAAGAGVLYTLGTLGIGAHTLSVTGGNVNSGAAGLTFGATTLSGTPTFNVANPAAGGVTELTLGAVGESSQQGLIKNGNGTLILSATNSYTGTTTVNTGILQFNSTGAIGGSGRSVALNAGAVVRFATLSDADIATAMGRITTDTTGVIAADNNLTKAFDFSTAGLTAASLGATSAATYSGTLTPNGTTYRLGGGGGDLTVSSNLTGSGNSLVVDNGSATRKIILAGTNTYTGSTTLLSGILQFNSLAAVGSMSAMNPSPGTIVAAGYDATQAFLTPLAGNTNAFTVALAVNSTNNLDFSASTGSNLPNARLGAVANAAYSGTLTPYGTTFKLGGGGATLTVNSDLTGPNGLSVSGGTVILAGAGSVSTFTGDVTVDSGTLQVASAGAFNNIARAVTVNSGGTANFGVADAAKAAAVAVNSGGTVNVTVANAVNGGSFAVNAGGLLAATGIANAFSGSTVTLNGGTLRFQASPLNGPNTVGGNILVNAGSTMNVYDSRSGRANSTIQFGTLDFAAADPIAMPTGYTLELSTAGQSIGYQPSTTYKKFVGSTISNSGRMNVNKAFSNENYADITSLDNTAIRAGKKLTLTRQTTPTSTNTNISVQLDNSLGVAMLGGAELLGATSFTMIDASNFPSTATGTGTNASGAFTNNSTFDTTNGLWVKSGTTTITATLANSVGSLAVGESLFFAAEDAAYVILTGLTDRPTYGLYLNLSDSADLSTVLTQLAKNPAFTNITGAGSQARLIFTPPAATSYFAWDNVHTTAADWYLGGNLTGVTLVVPEPSALALLGAGLLGIAASAGRKRRS